MKTAFAPSAGEVSELVRTALAQGHTVILPAPDHPTKVATALPHVTGSSFAVTFRLLFNLAPAEGRLFAALLENDHVNRKEVHASIACNGDPVTNIRSIDVMVHKLRKKLARHDIAVINIWGLGFMIDKETRDRVRRMIADHRADSAGAATTTNIASP